MELLSITATNSLFFSLGQVHVNAGKLLVEGGILLLAGRVTFLVKAVLSDGEE
jgi:hypothetical protein